jgi:ABC-type nitrate/sulfonate/bicarbonate transport system permease component
MAVMDEIDQIEPRPAGAVAERGGEAPRRRALRVPSRLLARLGLFSIGVAAIVLAWVVGSHYFASYILPDPGAVWDAFRSDWERGVWWSDVKATLGHMFAAYGLTIVIGLPLGVLIGRYWPVEDLTRPFLIFLQTLPTVILIVIVLIFVGSTAGGVVAVATASCLPYFTLNVIQGTKAIDADLVEMAHVYRANEATIMRSVIVPSVVPFFLAGARITLGVAWQVTLFAEYLMGVHGIGFQISGAIGLLETDEVYVWGVTVVLLTIVFEYGVFRPIERLLTRHTRRAT